MTKRRNGEALIFPYRNGYAAYASRPPPMASVNANGSTARPISKSMTSGSSSRPAPAKVRCPRPRPRSPTT